MAKPNNTPPSAKPAATTTQNGANSVEWGLRIRKFEEDQEVARIRQGVMRARKEQIALSAQLGDTAALAELARLNGELRGIDSEIEDIGSAVTAAESERAKAQAAEDAVRDQARH